MASDDEEPNDDKVTAEDEEGQTLPEHIIKRFKMDKDEEARLEEVTAGISMMGKNDQELQNSLNKQDGTELKLKSKVRKIRLRKETKGRWKTRGRKHHNMDGGL